MDAYLKREQSILAPPHLAQINEPRDVVKRLSDVITNVGLTVCKGAMREADKTYMNEKVVRSFCCCNTAVIAGAKRHNAAEHVIIIEELRIEPCVSFA